MESLRGYNTDFPKPDSKKNINFDIWSRQTYGWKLSCESSHKSLQSAYDELSKPDERPWDDLINLLQSRKTALLVLAVFIPLWVTLPVIHGPLMLWLWSEPLSLAMDSKRVLNSGTLI